MHILTYPLSPHDQANSLVFDFLVFVNGFLIHFLYSVTVLFVYVHENFFLFVYVFLNHLFHIVILSGKERIRERIILCRIAVIHLFFFDIFSTCWSKGHYLPDL